MRASPIRRLTFVWVVLCGWTAAACADDLQATTSLRFVPADAGFYMTSLRIKEQYDIFKKSRAYERLYNMPSLQLGLSFLDAQYRSKNFAEVRGFLKEKANKDLLALLQDAGTRELFAYSDAGLIESFSLMQEVSNELRKLQLEAGFSGDADSTEIKQSTVRKLVQRLLESKDKLRLSPFVFGARTSKPEIAKEQLSRLEKVLGDALPSIEEAKFEVARQALGGGDFVTVSLALKSIDWSDLEGEVEDDLKEEVRPLLEHLKAKTFVIAIGVRDDYLMLSLGESVDHLKTLGAGPLLSGVPDFQRIVGHQDERITNIWYASRRLIEVQQRAAAEQILTVSEMVRKAMTASNTPEETKAAFEKDLKSLEDQATAETIKNPHSTLGCSFLTERGTESIQYQVGAAQRRTGTPLPILGHVGGSPLLFAVTRSPASEDDYESLRPALERLLGYVDTVVDSNIDDENRGEYERVRDLTVPYLKRLDSILADDLVPALKDGQIGIVIDARATSTKWFPEMPEAADPLPMLEFGLVLGLSDEEKFKGGMSALYTLVGDVLNTLHAENPDDFPEITLPSFTEESQGGGNVYALEVPEELGIDRQLAGCLGVGANYAIFTTSRPQAERVLQETPFALPAPLAGPKDNLLSVQHVDFAAFIDTLVPWMNYGFDQVPVEDDNASSFGINVIRGQIETVLTVIRCYQGTTSISYADEGTIISHSESRFEDLPE